MLGANDGIISVSVILISVIGIIAPNQLWIIGVSSIFGGAVSMAIGEYISVSAQRDAELSHNHTELTNPYHAAFSSFLSFVVGAIIPLIAAGLFYNIWAVVIAVMIALLITTVVSVYVGKVNWRRPVIRNLLSGGAALGLGILLHYVFGAV